MTKPLSGLNKKLLKAAINAGLASEGDAPLDDEKDTDAEDDEGETTPPASKKKGNKAGKPKTEDTTDDEEVTGEEDEDESMSDDEDDVDAEDEDEDESAEGEDDEDVDAEDDEEETPPVSKKATGEKGRIQAILESPLAAGRERLASHLAFHTNSSVKTAEAILGAAPQATKATSLRSRMAAVDNPKIKQGAGKATTEADEVKAAIATVKQFGF